jgi:Zn-dependent peptidase ImmA (M78 family)
MGHLMTKPNLDRAAHAAYLMRLKYDPTGRYLRFDPFLPISTTPWVRVCRYTTFCDQQGMDIRELLRMVSSDGFSLRERDKYIIVYNDAPSISAGRKRFTLAHELGHCLLRHRTDGEAEEQEANTFARCLLAPIWLAQQRGIGFADYPAAFGISAAAARMCEKLYKLDLLLYNPLSNK